MKVKELIELLSELNPEHIVVTTGYEGGCKELVGVGECTIALNVNDEWYYGPHEVVYPHDDQYNVYKQEKAVFVS